MLVAEFAEDPSDGDERVVRELLLAQLNDVDAPAKRPREDGTRLTALWPRFENEVEPGLLEPRAPAVAKRRHVGQAYFATIADEREPRERG